MKYLLLLLTFALLYMGCSKPVAAPPRVADGTFPTIRCADHPLPQFVLGVNQHPTEQEQATLCDCIWSQLGERRRIQSFPTRFGEAIRSCSTSPL